jgi:hypothetical protein
MIATEWAGRQQGSLPVEIIVRKPIPAARQLAGAWEGAAVELLPSGGFHDPSARVVRNGRSLVEIFDCASRLRRYAYDTAHVVVGGPKRLLTTTPESEFVLRLLSARSAGRDSASRMGDIASLYGIATNCRLTRNDLRRVGDLVMIGFGSEVVRIASGARAGRRIGGHVQAALAD